MKETIVVKISERKFWIAEFQCFKKVAYENMAMYVDDFLRYRKIYLQFQDVILQKGWVF